MPFSKPNNFKSAQERMAEAVIHSFRSAQGRIAVAEPIEDQLTAVPNQYLPFNAEDLYQRTVVANLDIKGNMASCYGSYGQSVIGTIGIDFGDIFFPGLVNLSLEAAGGATQMKAALLIIHRNNSKLCPYPVGAENKSPDNISFPICFMTMAGKKQKLAGKFDVKASVGKKIPNITNGAADSPEAAALQLEFSATLGTGIDVVALHVADPTPGWYPNWRDKNLNSDFSRALGNVSTDKLKKEVIDWYEYIIAYSIDKLANIQHPTQQNSSDLATLEKEINIIASEHNLQKKTKEILSNAVKTGVDDVVSNKKIGTLIQGLLTKLINTPPSIETLITDLGILKGVFLQWEDHPERNQILKNINWNLTQLVLAKNDPLDRQKGFFHKIGHKMKMGNSAVTDLQEHLSELSFTAFIPNASATIAADLSITGKKANAKASASAGITGQMGVSTYRYQNFGIAEPTVAGVPKTIVFTQDTEINFRQISATAAAGFNITDKIKGKKEKTFNYNQINYRAAQVYWTLPDPDETDPITLVLDGSGVSYGFSIRPQALIDLSVAIGKTLSKPNITGWTKEYNEETNNFHDVLLELYKNATNDFVKNGDKKLVQLLKTVAAALHISIYQVVEFLDGSTFHELDSSNMGKVTAIILESNYKLNDRVDLTVPLNRKKNKVIAKDLLIAFEKGVEVDIENNFQDKIASLASIRVRFRMADHIEAEETVFKLGVSVFAKVGIELKTVSRAGIDGIIDVYTYWFPPFRHLFMEPDDLLESQMVPPVSLFFQ